MARLDRYNDGKLTGSLVLRQRDYLVGRDPDCDLVLQDKLASRRHFMISWNDEGFYVFKDLQTSNGTLVDGVKEFTRKLTVNCTIQVGQELILFSSYESSVDDSGDDALPAWALKGDDFGFETDKTAHMAPSMLQRLQARVRARQKPHLILYRPNETAVFPLEAAITTVGFGPVRASLGPTPDGRPKVLAEVHRKDNGEFRIRTPGWFNFFKRIEINGVMLRQAPLNPGDKVRLGETIVEFSSGIKK